MTIMPTMSVNNSYPKQTNVIPPVQRKSYPASQVNFSGHDAAFEGGYEGEKDSHWFLKLLLVGVVGFVGYKYFKKPVRNFLIDLKIKGISELLKNAEKKEVFTWDEAKTAMKDIVKNSKGAKKGFIFRLTETQRTEHKLSTKEAFLLGYEKGDRRIPIKAIICEKLDDKLTKNLEGKDYISF